MQMCEKLTLVKMRNIVLCLGRVCILCNILIFSQKVRISVTIDSLNTQD